MSPSTYKEVIHSLHTDAVTRMVHSLLDNGVLEDKAPPAAREEYSLPRPYRSTLCQLCFGFCFSLNSFLVKIGRTAPTWAASTAIFQIEAARSTRWATNNNKRLLGRIRWTG